MPATASLLRRGVENMIYDGAYDSGGTKIDQKSIIKNNKNNNNEE